MSLIVLAFLSLLKRGRYYAELLFNKGLYSLQALKDFEANPGVCCGVVLLLLGENARLPVAQPLCL